MPKWNVFLEEDLDVPKFEKFDKSKRIERAIIKRAEEKEQLRRKERQTDEKRKPSSGEEI